MKDKIYPAFYRDTDKSIYLYSNADNYYCFGRGMWDKTSDEDDHEDDTNITREYLANTCGKVYSPEHGLFIRLMCEKHGITVNEYPSQLDSYFAVYGNELLFFHNGESASGLGGKLITIPMPPKEVVIGEKKSEVYMPELNAVSSGFVVASGEPLNYKVIGGANGDFDNVLSTTTPVEAEKPKGSEFNSYLNPKTPYGGPIGDGGYYALKPNTGGNESSRRVESNSDEWPVVGSEVTWGEGKINGIVKCVDGNQVWISLPDDDHATISVERLRKPKTPEEELRDEFAKDLNSIYLLSDIITASPSCDDDFKAYANEMIKLGWVKSGKQ